MTSMEAYNENWQRQWQRPISYQDVALCLCSMFISLNKIKIKYSLHQYSILMHILGNWQIVVHCLWLSMCLSACNEVSL